MSADSADVTVETENNPAMEVHIGEVRSDDNLGRYRHCIIWLNGKRWEGELLEDKNG